MRSGACSSGSRGVLADPATVRCTIDETFTQNYNSGLPWGKEMANSEDLERARAGKTAWNEWAKARRAAKEAPLADFSGEQIAGISFEGFIFPGQANFSGAEFSETARFKCAKFYGLASFSRAIFLAEAELDRIWFFEDANFNDVRFEKSTNFDHSRFCKFANFYSARFCEKLSIWAAKFSGEANFQHARFNRSEFTGVRFESPLTRFTGASFQHVPDFWATTFATPPLFQGVKVGCAKDPGAKFYRRWFSYAAGPDDAVRFRRLKQLASEWKDHQLELDFFANELRAKRGTETKGFFPVLLNVGYGWLSDFGRSIARPFWSLFILTGVAAVGTFVVYSPTCAMRPAWAALKVAFTNAALFLGADKWEIRSDAITKLCGAACKAEINADPLAYVQSGISLLLLFLLALGLRNRFRIGSNVAWRTSRP
jgi:hypothetical protein